MHALSMPFRYEIFTQNVRWRLIKLSRNNSVSSDHMKRYSFFCVFSHQKYPFPNEIFSHRRRSWHSWEIWDPRRNYNTRARARAISSASNQNSRYLKRDTSRPFYHVARFHRLKIPGIFASKLDTVRRAVKSAAIGIANISGGKISAALPPPPLRQTVASFRASHGEFGFRERSV